MSDQPTVYLVVMGERGGLFGAFYDPDRARQAAKAIKGTVCPLVILEDYREEPA